MHFSNLFKYCPVCGSDSFATKDSKSKQCGQCAFVYYINASAAVASFIVNEAGELLVCRRAKEPSKGSLDLAGGFIDQNETAEEAVAREIKEEIGAEVRDAKYLFSIPNQYEYSGLTVPTLDMFFECKLDSYENLLASDDVAECFFLPFDQIKIEDFGFKSIQEGLRRYLNK